MRWWAVLCAVLWSCTALAQEAGTVDFVDGEVKIIDSANQPHPARLGEILKVGDTVHTGATGELHVAMRDGGEIGVHANTRLKVEQYKADGGNDDSSVLSLLQGAMRSVTGWIGKYNRSNYAIKTPTATIGVRGTDHETLVIPEGSQEGKPGTYDKVNAGATQIRTQYGSTEVRPNQAGFVPFGARSRPALLAKVPDIFHPLRHSKRFEGLNEHVRERADQLRQERVKRVVSERQERKKTMDAERQRQKLERPGKAQRERREESRPAAPFRAAPRERQRERGSTRPFESKREKFDQGRARQESRRSVFQQESRAGKGAAGRHGRHER